MTMITFLVIEYGLEKPSVHTLFDSKETGVSKGCVTWLRWQIWLYPNSFLQ